MGKRRPADPVYNKLAFRGYHIEGEYNGLAGLDGFTPWESFVDRYPTLALYEKSWSSVGLGVFSPREIYLQQMEDGFYRNIVIRDNDNNILWDEAKELDFLHQTA